MELPENYILHLLIFIKVLAHKRMPSLVIHKGDVGPLVDDVLQWDM